jgi:hypothetical protein
MWSPIGFLAFSISKKRKNPTAAPSTDTSRKIIAERRESTTREALADARRLRRG